MYYNEKHAKVVEQRGDNYQYIGSYKKGDILNNGNVAKEGYLRVKCPYCGTEYDVSRGGFGRGNKCNYCCNEYENSFAYHIEKELNLKLDDVWDFNKNTFNPYCIYKNSRRKVWIKCTEKDYHGSYEIQCYIFNEKRKCPYCNPFASHKVHPKDSFAQYHIDNTDKDFIEKYGSDNNTLNPWELSPCSHHKIFIKCQNKDYHEDYKVTCANFTKGRRCPYCTNHHGKVHPFDSFGSLFPEIAKLWDYKNNKKTPFEISPYSNYKFSFICPSCKKHFSRAVCDIIRHKNVSCGECATSQGERLVFSYLYNNKINFETQKTFKRLIGLGGGNLSYDFYLPKYNLLIEFQGEQHEHYVDMFHTTKNDFKKQQEHDKRKREYAKNHNIKLLEIWYWDYDNIEEILNKELDLH